MSHTCKAALVRCMDFRLEGAIEKYLEQQNLVGDCDIISVAGAGKDLAENAEGYLAGQIELSVGLHSIDTLILMHHTDCGGYGGSSKHENHEAEIDFHASEMRKSKAILSEKYPELTVKMVLAVIGEDGVSFKDFE